jgi:hypothetical protein
MDGGGQVVFGVASQSMVSQCRTWEQPACDRVSLPLFGQCLNMEYHFGESPGCRPHACADDTFARNLAS